MMVDEQPALRLPGGFDEAFDASFHQAFRVPRRGRLADPDLFESAGANDG